MTTSHLSSDRNDSAVTPEVKTRRTRAPLANQETYGADNLPVLIRLPDLTVTAPRVVAKPVRVPDDETTAAASAPTTTLPVTQGAACSGETPSTTTNGRRTSALANRRTRRGSPGAAPVRPSGGMGQYLLAVLLAVALFAIIVTIKESRQAASAKKPAAGRTQVEAPAADFGQSTPSPAVHLDPPELAPAANAVSEPPRGPVETALDTGEPVAPDAAGYADGAVQVTEYYDSYPSTNVEPVQPQSAAASSAPAGTWPSPAGGRPLQSADRNPTDVRYQQR